MHPMWKPRRKGAVEAAREAEAAGRPLGSEPPQSIDDAVTALVGWLVVDPTFRQRHFVNGRTLDLYPGPYRDQPPALSEVAKRPRFATRTNEEAVEAVVHFASLRERRAVRAFCGGMVVDVYPEMPAWLASVGGAPFPSSEWIYRFDLEVLDVDERRALGES